MTDEEYEFLKNNIECASELNKDIQKIRFLLNDIESGDWISVSFCRKSDAGITVQNPGDASTRVRIVIAGFMDKLEQLIVEALKEQAVQCEEKFKAL